MKTKRKDLYITIDNHVFLDELIKILEPHIIKLIEEQNKVLQEKVVQIIQGESEKRTIVSEKELVNELKVSRQTLSSWRRDNKIPYFRINGQIRYDLEEILKLHRVEEK